MSLLYRVIACIDLILRYCILSECSLPLHFNKKREKMNGDRQYTH